jgi:ABC-type glycerol-3-phosphate transport system substrate-binding protein
MDKDPMSSGSRRSAELNYTFRMRVLGGLVLLAAVLLTGCGMFGGDSEEPVLTVEVQEPTPVATPTLMSIPQSTPATGVTSPDTINVWIANQFSPLNDPEGGTILVDHIASFQTSHPELDVNVDSKAPTGPGGILSYLRAGNSVAPGIMPDLVMLPSEELERAALQGLIYPIEGFLTQEMQDDLFPAAGSISQVDGEIFGYPFSLTDMHHLVYDGDLGADSFPETWNDLIEVEDAQFAFPARGYPGAEMALQLYLAAGGSLTNESNQPFLDVDALTQALSQFSRAAAGGVILRESANLATVDDAWQMLDDGDANIVQSEASAYLSSRQSLPETDPARVPGFESALRPFVNGWVWAISTPDPDRQILAAELLASIASGPNIGEWSIAAEQLPARRSAYDQWPVNISLTRFFSQASEHAHQFPEAASEEIMSALSDAVIQVIVSSKSPRSAAEEASQSIRP